jgi:ADP-heptose:LPS heptosyltransferase
VHIEAQRIAIIKLGAIGDVVNSLPFVNRLRAGYPRSKITWVIAPIAHALVSGHRAVDEFLVIDVKQPGKWPEIVRELRAREFDLAIDLQRILKSGLITRATGAGARLGFDRARCKEQSWLFTNHKIAPNGNPGVTVEQYLEFADWLECPQSPPRFDLPVEPFEPPTREETRIVVNVGASKPANRWYTDKWARLCTRLVSELGATIHFTGGQQDTAEIEAVMRAMETGAAERSDTDVARRSNTDATRRSNTDAARLVSHAGKLSLKASAGLIASAHLFLGCDTGPLHIAVAVGTPVVALFGASDPRRTGPFGQSHGVVQEPAPCSPCRRRDCHVAGQPCMSRLSEERVFERARELLAPRQR